MRMLKSDLKPNSQTCDLSVIIVSRNEENNIARCIESVLKATEYIKEAEIILVDSASRDKTVEIARKFPIKIIQLSPSWQLSAAAGYYVGFMNSVGKYIQFQCGDTILDEGWIKKGIQALERDVSIGVVTGIITQEPYGTVMAKKYAHWFKSVPIGEVKTFINDSLFRRNVLLDVGTFNPHLRANEEGELCYRVINGGYKVLRLPYKMSHHLGCRGQNSDHLWSILRYTAGQGQVLRYATDNKQILWWRMKDYKFGIVLVFLTAFLLLGLVAFFILDYRPVLYIWGVCMLLLFGWILHDQKNVNKAVKVIIYWSVASPLFVRGFLKRKKDPNTYYSFLVVSFIIPLSSYAYLWV